LANNPVEQNRCALRNAIFFRKKFLKLVNQQQRARHRLLATGTFVTSDVLHAKLTE